MALWGKVIDQSRCIGCHACTIACKAEHQVPIGVTRTYVKQVEVGLYPNVERHFQVTRCNQCEDAPCVAICPVEALHRRLDGIVDFDREVCIGCKACMAACPYDALYIDPVSHSAEKCNFCAHRIDQGLEPACVAVCPERAIIVGDLSDPTSEVSRWVATGKAEVRKPEKATQPKLFYVDSSLFTRVPALAQVPVLHAAAEQRERYPAPVARPGPAPLRGGPGVNGHLRHGAGPGRHDGGPGRSSAAAIVQYDVPHGPPWDWRVSAYTWTKSLAAGAYLVSAAMAWAGLRLSPAVELASSLLALLFLGATGLLLVADLEQPARFWRILVRPQWRSWLARGAFLITLYGALLAADVTGRLAGWEGMAQGLRAPGVLLAAATAVYTAFLFAQARARDLWQSPILPLHLLVQAVLAGAAGVLILDVALAAGGAGTTVLRNLLVAAAILHATLALSEVAVGHPTADGRQAADHLIRGAFSGLFWGGILLAAAGAGAAAIGWGGAAAALALMGALAHEHAYVQAGQSVPLS
ncbi:4Fe-4S dicluster domain-containing protein [Limnochorda pilosa]|uniref:4Fe-4S ferredoxin n=1 Tax=Limnochorda pilosa TaxID=1555112 RepID=A0A0K2SQ58_LIMPI|nr:4Fe-4S dicluster domain-containing protein [Limnochorda pilosa]BAS29226.1 4Fe-4S ferredoxin [Limnochorda pilosa]